MLEQQVDMSPSAVVPNQKLGTCHTPEPPPVCQTTCQAPPAHCGADAQYLIRSRTGSAAIPINPAQYWTPDAQENLPHRAWPALADHVSPFDDRFFTTRRTEIQDESPCSGTNASPASAVRSTGCRISDVSPGKRVKERPSSTSSSPQRRKGFPRVAWTSTPSTASPQSKSSGQLHSPQVARGRLAISERPAQTGQHESEKTSPSVEAHDSTGFITPRFEVLRSAATSPACNRSPSCRHRGRSPSERAIRSIPHVQCLLGCLENVEAVCATAESLLFESLPTENVQGLKSVPLDNIESRDQFLKKIRAEGSDTSRIRIAWHLAGSAAAARAIESEGIRCDDGHCACGRYGRGGYVATSAAKANAYADSDGYGGERHMFVVLSLPGDELVRGERGTRPPCTAADLPSHPTEYCFVDPARLHCVCRLEYTWVPTGRRPKVATAGGHCRAWRSSSRLASPRRR